MSFINTNDKIGIVRLRDITLYAYNALWGVRSGILYVELNGRLFSRQPLSPSVSVNLLFLCRQRSTSSCGGPTQCLSWRYSAVVVPFGVQYNVKKSLKVFLMLHGLFFMSVDSVYHGYSKIEKLINCTSKKREKQLVFCYYFSPLVLFT